MAKQKKISIKDLDSALKKDNRIGVENKIEWNGLDILVKYTVSLKDIMSIAEGVTRICFTDEGIFIPEVKDFAFKCFVIDTYSNVALPSDTEKKYDIAVCSGLFEAIVPYIYQKQLYELQCAVEDKVAHRAQANIEMITKQMEELYNKFNEICNGMTEITSQINPDDISKLADAMANGSLSEEKIVEAYMKQSKPKVKIKTNLKAGE